MRQASARQVAGSVCRQQTASCLIPLGRQTQVHPPPYYRRMRRAQHLGKTFKNAVRAVGGVGPYLGGPIPFF